MGKGEWAHFGVVGKPLNQISYNTCQLKLYRYHKSTEYIEKSVIFVEDAVSALNKWVKVTWHRKTIYTETN